MRVLLDERNIIKAIGSGIEFGVWGNVGDAPSWKLSPTRYTMDNNYTVAEVGEVPSYVTPNLYRYENGEFVLNEECPNEYKERIAELESQVALADETTIELYEAQLAQDEANSAQDEAIIELYELYENLQS